LDLSGCSPDPDKHRLAMFPFKPGALPPPKSQLAHGFPDPTGPKWVRLLRSTGRDAMLFFNFIQNKRPDLLAFSGSDDKWQVAHGWLLNAT
jgi:hypothetical protein